MWAYWGVNGHAPIRPVWLASGTPINGKSSTAAAFHIAIRWLRTSDE